MLFEVIQDGKVVAVLDPDNDSCNPWAGGDYNGHCGGCDSCLFQQASFYGMEIREVETNGSSGGTGAEATNFG